MSVIKTTKSFGIDLDAEEVSARLSLPSAAPADRALLETERSPRKKFLPGDGKAAKVSTPCKTRERGFGP